MIQESASGKKFILIYSLGEGRLVGAWYFESNTLATRDEHIQRICFMRNLKYLGKKEYTQLVSYEYQLTDSYTIHNLCADCELRLDH